MTLLILLIALTGCGKSTQQEQNLGQFSPIVTKFIADAKAHNRDVDASHLIIEVHHFESAKAVSGMSIGTSGECNFDAVNGPTVWISDAALTFGPVTLEALIYHELGHCLLMRAHKNEVDSRKAPVSLMNSNGVVGETYQADRDGYLKELFQ